MQTNHYLVVWTFDYSKWQPSNPITLASIHGLGPVAMKYIPWKLTLNFNAKPRSLITSQSFNSFYWAWQYHCHATSKISRRLGKWKIVNAQRIFHEIEFTWWRHQMETFSALLAICAGNSPVPGEFPTQRPVTRSFDVFFDQRLNKRLNKQSWGWWFDTLSRPLWRHCYEKLFRGIFYIANAHNNAAIKIRSENLLTWHVYTVKPVYNDHLMGYFSAFWSSSRWPRAT